MIKLSTVNGMQIYTQVEQTSGKKLTMNYGFRFMAITHAYTTKAKTFSVFIWIKIRFDFWLTGELMSQTELTSRTFNTVLRMRIKYTAYTKRWWWFFSLLTVEKSSLFAALNDFFHSFSTSRSATQSQLLVVFVCIEVCMLSTTYWTYFFSSEQANREIKRKQNKQEWEKATIHNRWPAAIAVLMTTHTDSLARSVSLSIWHITLIMAFLTKTFKYWI